jgi:RNA polymerase sigma-70 factor (ECF subfamily)
MEPTVVSLRREERESDGQLLERFITCRDETAFSDLVHRYAGLVLGVCLRVLGDSHQAEDAFQATFLVLVRRAKNLDRSGPLGNWLYAVAFRTATKARMIAARRRARERQSMYSSTEPYTIENQAWDDLRPILDQELSQLPGKYRAPLVLCYLEGKTQQEAAQELGWPSGSMSRRMNRARQLLRDRLKKRGLANSLALAMLFWLMQQKATAAVVSPALVESTIKVALACAAGKTLGLMNVADLTNEAVLSTGRSRAKLGYLTLALVMLLGIGGIVSATWMFETAWPGASSTWVVSPPPPTVVVPLAQESNGSATAQKTSIMTSCHN